MSTPKLPKAVERELRAAEAIEAQLRQAEDNPPPPPPTIAQVVESATAQAPVSPPPAPTPAPTPPAPPAPPTVDWEQKFRSLQGVFNAEVPKLQAQVRELQGQIAQVTRPAQEPTPPAPTQPDQKDIDGFGVDMVNMVRRVAEQMVAPVLQHLDTRLRATEGKLAQLEPTVGQAAQTAAQTAEATFFAHVEKLVPDWQDVNKDPAFLNWLSQVEPMYGKTRQDALNEARSSLNAERVAHVFNAFKSSRPAPAPAPSQLANQQAPTASGGSAPPVQVAPPTFMQKQVADFYNDLARGKYRGREQEATRIEQAINLAAAEGRIR